MSQAANWTLSGDDIIALDGSSPNTRTVTYKGGTGTATIRVTSTGSTTALHQPFAEYVVTVLAATTNVEEVIITAPALGHEMNAAGQKLTLVGSILPITSPQGITWSVAANADGTGVTTLATIEDGNVLTVGAALPSADTMVYVVATSDQDSSKSTIRGVMIKAPTVGARTVAFTFGPNSIRPNEVQYNWTAADPIVSYVVGGLTMTFPQVTQFRWDPTQSVGGNSGRIAANGAAARAPLATITGVQGPFKVKALFAGTNTDAKTTHIHIGTDSVANSGEFATSNVIVEVSHSYTGTDIVDISFHGVGSNFTIYRIEVEFED